MKTRNDNPMPPLVYQAMLPYIQSPDGYDVHHALVDRGDVKGMPLEERQKIHDIRNLWWVRSSDHASHANIEDKRLYYRALCSRFGKPAIDDFIRSFNWKSKPPVTIEWLENK